MTFSPSFLKHPAVQHIVSCEFLSVNVFMDFPLQRPPFPSSGKRRICRLHENTAVTISMRRTDSPQKPAQSKPTHK